jgi:hypothetical protein
MKPGIKTIITGAVVFVVGAFVAPLLILLSLVLGQPHDLQFKVPGTAETSVDAPGRYYLWNDYRTVFDGKNYDQSQNIPNGMEFRIRDAEGRQLQFISAGLISTSSGRSSKQSIGYVEVTGPGKIEIQVTGGDEERVFSFSRSGFLKLIAVILGGFGVSMLAGLTGFVLIIWGLVKLVKGNKSGKQNLAGGSRQS